MLLYLLLLLLLIIPLLFLCLLYVIYKPPLLLINYLQTRYPDVLFRITTTSNNTNTNKKLIALTIDDSPSPNTKAIHKQLEAHNTHATFFVIGSYINSCNEEILIDLVRSGNELANHAMRDEPSVSLPIDALREQIRAVHGMIKDIYTKASVDHISSSSSSSPSSPTSSSSQGRESESERETETEREDKKKKKDKKK